MAVRTRKNRCENVRQRLAGAVGGALAAYSGWLEGHVAGCPRCQRRIRGFSRLSLALALVKTQSHQPDLLTRANAAAVRMLKRPVRQTTQAEALRHMLPRPTFLARIGKYTQPAGNAAACVLVLALLKIGVFSATEKFQQSGRQAIRDYYAAHVDQDILDQIL